VRIAFIDDILRFSIPLGITGIAGILRQGGHDVDVWVAGPKLDRTIDEVAAFRPDAVAFSVMSGSQQGYFDIARRAKEQLGVPTIWGGPHPTFFPEIIELPWVDAVCVGEGEEAALQFADRFDCLGNEIPTDVPNFWVKRDGEIHRNPVRPRIRALDDLPWPARSLYLDKFAVLRNHGIKHFMAHRGCPYACTYCFNDGFNAMYREQAGDGKVFNSRSADSVVDEILYTRELAPVRMVSFVDDVFTLHRKWTTEFAEVYGRRCRIPFSVNTRFDNVDEELVQALSEAGLRLVYAGVESGDEVIRNTVMQRQMSEESMYRTAALYKKCGVKLLTENIIGVPGETFETAMRTLRLNIEIKPAVANASIFAPYPKLELTRYAIENGYFDGNVDRLSSNYYHDSVLEFASERERRRILNLRCFFSMISHHPWMFRLVKPLLDARPNAIYRWFGDLLDGYYLMRCVAYRFSAREFLSTVRHFVTSYR
jgi:radical SAM superfamily enzyme YgiQ (UPF0313 family)